MSEPPRHEAPGSGDDRWGGWYDPPSGGDPGYGPPSGASGAGHGPPGSVPPGWGPPGAGQGWGGPPPPGFGPPREPKPGIIPLRPIGLGEILDGAVTYVRRNPKATLGLAAIVVAVVQVVTFLLQVFVFRQDARIASVDPDAVTPRDAFGLIASTLAALGVAIVFVLLASLVLTGMLTAVIGRAVLGRPMTMGEAWRESLPRLPALIGVSLVIDLLMVAGTVALWGGGIALGLALANAGLPAVGALLGILLFFAWIPLMVWIYITFSVATPAIVLERAGVGAALGRSRALVRGSFWRVLGILLLAWLIAVFIGWVLRVPFLVVRNVFFGAGVATGIAADVDLTSFVVGQVIVTVGAIVSGIVVRPFSSGVPALLYVDLRMRREGLDMRLQDAAGVTRGDDASGSGPAFSASGPRGTGYPPSGPPPPTGWPGGSTGPWGGRPPSGPSAPPGPGYPSGPGPGYPPSPPPRW